MNRCQELFEELQNLQNQVSQKENELERAQTESTEREYKELYSYWCAHGGVQGKCFKYREDDYLKRNNYYRIHKLVDNVKEDSYPMVAVEHIILDDEGGNPFFFFGWDECFALSKMFPEYEISLSEYLKAKEQFNEELKRATNHIKEEMK